MGPILPFMNNISTIVLIHRLIFQKHKHNYVLNWQGTNQMGLSDSLDDYKKKYFINMKMSPAFLNETQKKIKE